MAKLTKPGVVPYTAISTSPGTVHLRRAGTAITLPQARLGCGLTQLKYIQICVDWRIWQFDGFAANSPYFATLFLSAHSFLEQADPVSHFLL